jgi:hypothetical protein
MLNQSNALCVVCGCSALRDQWVREGNAFLLVYAINSAQSLRDLQSFRERILLVNEERQVQAPMYVWRGGGQNLSVRCVG